MADKKTMTTIRAVASLERGGIIFEHEVDQMVAGNLNGLVANSELCKCTNGEFTWYFAWKQRDSESVADKANQMATAVRGDE